MFAKSWPVQKIWLQFNETFSILILDDFRAVIKYHVSPPGKSLTRDGAAEVLEEHVFR